MKPERNTNLVSCKFFHIEFEFKNHNIIDSWNFFFDLKRWIVFTCLAIWVVFAPCLWFFFEIFQNMLKLRDILRSIQWNDLSSLLKNVPFVIYAWVMNLQFRLYSLGSMILINTLRYWSNLTLLIVNLK